MLRFTGTAVILGVLFTLPAQAQTLDFEDLTAGTVYEQFDSFITHGVTVEVMPTPAFGQILVTTGGLAGGTGNELTYDGFVGLRYIFPNDPTMLTMKIGNYGANGTFYVNGDDVGNILGFNVLSDLDGMSAGGVDFSLLSSQTVSEGEFGVLELSGSISTLELFHFGFALDDIAAIPEPASLMTLLALASCAALRRRRGLSPRSPGSY